MRTVSNLNVMTPSLMIPLFIQLKQLTINAITKYLDDAYFKFILMLFVYISVINIGFFLVWIPFLRNLNSIKQKIFFPLFQKKFLLIYQILINYLIWKKPT